MQLSNTGPSLDGFTMEHNEHMICCGMSGVLEPGIVVGTLAASGSGATRTGGLSGGGGGVGGVDGTRGPLVAVSSTAGGAGQGVKMRAASRGKEGFFCKQYNSTSTLPYTHPPSSQEITVSKETVPNQATMKKAWPMPRDLS